MRPSLDRAGQCGGYWLSPVTPLPDLWRRLDDLAIPVHLAAELKPYGMSVSASGTLIVRRVGHLVAPHQLDLIRGA
jgi:hypothetical protein